MTNATKEEQIQARIAQMKNAPHHVKAAALWSAAFGIVTFARFMASAYDARRESRFVRRAHPRVVFL